METVADPGATHRRRRLSDNAATGHIDRRRFIAIAAISAAIIAWLAFDQVLATYEAGMRKGSPLREVVIAALPADNQTGFGRWPDSFNVGQIQQNSLESLLITTGAARGCWHRAQMWW